MINRYYVVLCLSPQAIEGAEMTKIVKHKIMEQNAVGACFVEENVSILHAVAKILQELVKCCVSIQVALVSLKYTKGNV